MDLIIGIHATELLRRKGSERIQFLCGKALRDLQGLSLDVLRGKVPGNGPVIVHGDYNINNLLISEDFSQILAVLD